MGSIRKSLPGPAELERARALILRHGWNATAYQILNPGIDLWFSRRGDAVIGHSDWGRVRVVAGAPVCDEARLPEVAEEFEAEAAAQGSRVCYFAAGTRLEGTLAEKRYAQAALGAQPVWDPKEWPGILERQPSLRAQLARARNKGVTVREMPAGAASGDPAIAACLREWLRRRRMPPMHFLIEPATLARLWDRRVFAAEKDGRAVGFLVASPVPRRNGWLIEQIVRGKTAPNGTAESLIDAAFHAAVESGIAYFTLGLAPLSRLSAFERQGQPLWLDVLFEWTRAHGGRFYNFRGLETFKAKFQPSYWEPIFALCNQEEFSPRILLAIAAVFSGRSPFLFLGMALLHAIRQEAAWMAQRLVRLARRARIGKH
jgi:phosphatidylglycerol lysyltransferase